MIRKHRIEQFSSYLGCMDLASFCTIEYLEVSQRFLENFNRFCTRSRLKHVSVRVIVMPFPRCSPCLCPSSRDALFFVFALLRPWMLTTRNFGACMRVRRGDDADRRHADSRPDNPEMRTQMELGRLLDTIEGFHLVSMSSVHLILYIPLEKLTRLRSRALST